MAPEVLYRVIYGSTSPQQWQKDLLTVRPAVLHNYCRHKVRYCDYPAIVPENSSTVRGTYVAGLTEGDLWRLDIFEGDEYIRKKVRARILDVVGDDAGRGNVEGEEVEAETYVFIAPEKLEVGEWDFGLFRREKMGAWVGKDDEYAEVDDAVAKSHVDPTGGRGRNGNITNQLHAENRKDLAIESAV